MEKWRTIPGYEGRYEVSDIGRVRSIPRTKVTKYFKNMGRTTAGMILKIRRDIRGYPQLTLVDKNRRAQTFKVHRLVMLAFQGESKLTVNHKDLDKENNRLSNLEYITSVENIKHAWKNGAMKCNNGERHHNSKLSDVERRRIKSLRGIVSQRKLAAEYGLTQAAIWAIQHSKFI